MSFARTVLGSWCIVEAASRRLGTLDIKGSGVWRALFRQRCRRGTQKLAAFFCRRSLFPPADHPKAASRSLSLSCHRTPCGAAREYPLLQKSVSGLNIQPENGCLRKRRYRLPSAPVHLRFSGDSPYSPAAARLPAPARGPRLWFHPHHWISSS